MFESLQGLVNFRVPRELTIAQSLTGLLAPPVCSLCGAAGQHGAEPWGLDLCEHCEAACPLAHDLCPRCAEPLPAHSLPMRPPRACAHCLQRSAAYDSVHSLFQYQAPVDIMITSLKFGHDLVFARVLGTLLARSRRQSFQPLPDCIVPVPLHRQRYLTRGFNQSAEIARHAGPRLGLPVESRLLLRLRDTAAQSGLDAAARARNLDRAFGVARDRSAPRSVALLDDVLTTGSTAEAAARALKSAGCERVELWVCARVLRHGPDTQGV